MKKNDFLHYLHLIIENKENQSIYYDNNEQYIYFYHGHFTYQLQSTPASAFVNIVEEQYGKKISQSIPLTQDEMIGLIDSCLPNIVTDNFYHEEKIKEKGQPFIDCIKMLDEYLKNYNPRSEIQKKESLEDFVLNFPFDGINHICRIGRIAKYDSKKDYNLTSLIKIPFFYLNSNDKKSTCIPYEIILPAWKAKEYPILENFINVKLFDEDFSITFDKMIQSFHNGKELHHEVLSSKFNDTNNKTKTIKI